jgi:hypothetical protein
MVVSGAIASGAAAQERAERVWVSVNGGVQATSNDFSDEFDIERYVETGTVRTEYPVDRGTLIDGGVGVRVWRQLGVGVAVSHVSSSGDASIDARIPHPFFDNRHREVQGTIGSTRRETDVHVQLAYLVPTRGPLRVVLSGGPSAMNVEQTIVTDIRYAETYPFDTAEFSGAPTRNASKVGIGFNVGADVAWMFTRTIGVGGLVRFAHASVKLDAGNDRRVSVDAGGLQVGGGVRISWW